MAHLSLSRISKRFGDFDALKDVSLDIASGEFICLLGASGCGKTTLLRLIAGLDRQDKGTLTLDGADLSAVPCHRRNIGMVFQSLALFPHLDVGGNIAYGLRLRGAAPAASEAEVQRLLELVGLPGLARRAVSALSGGQRQRVAIARALALQPAIFLMDEPFSALDAGLRDQMQTEVKALQRQLGVTTVFVTHDQREAMALADRVVVMHDGRIEQADAPQTLYARPATRFVAEFFGETNLLDLEIDADAVHFGAQSLGVPAGTLSTQRGRCTIAVRPEALGLSTDPTNAALRGTYVSGQYLGALWEGCVDVDGTLLQCRCFANQAPHLAPGDSVYLSWDVADAWVLPA